MIRRFIPTNDVEYKQTNKKVQEKGEKKNLPEFLFVTSNLDYLSCCPTIPIAVLCCVHECVLDLCVFVCLLSPPSKSSHIQFSSVVEKIKMQTMRYLLIDKMRNISATLDWCFFFVTGKYLETKFFVNESL